MQHSEHVQFMLIFFKGWSNKKQTEDQKGGAAVPPVQERKESQKQFLVL